MLIATDEKTRGPGEVESVRGALKTSDASASIVVVTPSDTVDIPGGPTRGLWVGGAGNVAILCENDSAPVTLTAVPAGTRLPIRVKRIYATGTTATLIVGLL